MHCFRIASYLDLLLHSYLEHALLSTLMRILKKELAHERSNVSCTTLTVGMKFFLRTFVALRLIFSAKASAKIQRDFYLPNFFALFFAFFLILALDFGAICCVWDGFGGYFYRKKCKFGFGFGGQIIGGLIGVVWRDFACLKGIHRAEC